MPVPQHELRCDYAIVGAGMGGLAAAHTLAARFPGATIAIFEAEAALGGRVRSKTLDTDSIDTLAVIELGAGRYHPRRHRRLSRLIADLDIPTRPFDYEMVRTTPGAIDFDAPGTLARLHRLRDTAPAKASFRAVVEAELGPIAFEALVQLSGYDTLRRDELPFVHGLEIISAHPETEAIWTGETGEWRAITAGFHQLPERMAARLEGRVAIHYNHRVKRLVRAGEEVVGLEAIGPRGTIEVRCRRVMCATPLHDVLALSDAACAAVDYRAQIVDVPLVKGYIEFENSFWPQRDRTRGQCVITACPFRKVYFSAAAPRMFFYCDGSSADRLSSLLAGTSLPELFKRDLPAIWPGVDATRVVAKRWGAHHWMRGISFWADGEQRVAGPIWSPEPGLAFLSDINTPELGWLEGALLTATALGEWLTEPQVRLDRGAGARFHHSHH